MRAAILHGPGDLRVQDVPEPDAALALLAQGAVPWRGLAAGPIGLDELPGALATAGGLARKWVVHP